MYVTGNLLGKDYILLEIYDGKLYLVHHLGGKAKRTLVREAEVSDGQPHEVHIFVSFLGRHSAHVCLLITALNKFLKSVFLFQI